MYFAASLLNSPHLSGSIFCDAMPVIPIVVFLVLIGDQRSNDPLSNWARPSLGRVPRIVRWGIRRIMMRPCVVGPRVDRVGMTAGRSGIIE